MRHPFIPILLLLFCGCGSTGYSRDIPSAALDAVCVASRQQLSDADELVTLRIVVERKTRFLATMVSLEALRARAGKATPVDISDQAQLLEQLQTTHTPHQLRVPHGGACRWLQRENAVPGELFLELSSPFDNPYKPGERGVLARLSLGGSMGASWFWVVLRNGGGRAVVAEAESLDIHDG
jgi:hypothetical protein